MKRGPPDRRILLAALAVCGLPIVVRAAPSSSVEHADIEVSGRKVPLAIWRAAPTRAVVVFSHGAGASPEAYHRLFEQWRAVGVSVVAPTFVDSDDNPDHDKYTLASAFVPRWRDVSAAVAYARTAFPGLKVGAAGHSYGSLFALMMAGGLPGVFGPPKAPVDAVVAFSSPGKIQPLVKPDAYVAVKAPLLVLTGDEDRVPTMVQDWREHLFAFETSAPGDKYAWVGKGVDHLYGGAIDRAPSASAQSAQFAEAAALSTLFLRAYLEEDEAARRALATRTDSALGHFSRR